MTASLEKLTKGLVSLAGLSIVVGIVAGLVCVSFRIALGYLDDWRTAWINQHASWKAAGLVLVVTTCALACGVAGWLVRRFAPEASGSGIPHVEAVVNCELPPASFWLLPVKFLGGWLAIGSGLALGREGPCVQMGACIGSQLGRVFRLSDSDVIAMLAGGAGAGLATAFNAPIAGAVFVLEELVRRFDTRIAIAALGASAGAITVERPFLGEQPDFQVGPLPYSGVDSWLLFLALGILAGLLGVAYNRSLLGALAFCDRLTRWPGELRAAVIGAGVGALAWFGPGLVGGGDALTQRTLAGGNTLELLPLLFGLRFVLGAVSYAAGTPGGLFAPMLVLGAQLGIIFFALVHWLLPGMGIPGASFAVVGMAAFFTAVVRAPLTGIILAVELTGGFTQLLPMLWASFAAMTVPKLLGNRPIYDSLKERMLRIA